jgi:hypothetical protein
MLSVFSYIFDHQFLFRFKKYLLKSFTHFKNQIIWFFAIELQILLLVTTGI